MKTTIKQLAAVTLVALLLLGGNGYAKGTQAKASSQETETGLSLENWMIKAEAWNLKSDFAEETESELQIENWMTSQETWNIENKTGETKLALENWMVNENVWNR